MSPTRSDPTVSLVVQGEIDLTSVASLVTRLASASQSQSQVVVVDLSQVTFMDYAGLRPLLDARRRLEEVGGRLVLQSPSRPVARLLQLGDPSHLLTIVDGPTPAVVTPVPEDHSPTAQPAAGPRRGSRLAEAAEAAVAHLQGRAPLELWMASLVEGADQIVLASAGRGAGRFSVGSSLPWLGSFGLHMAAGRAPRVASRALDVALYAAAATGRWSHVRGYTGVPLLRRDGVLVGTLCGFSHREDDPSILEAAEPLSLVAGMLSLIAESEHELVASLEELDRARELADTDALTSLRNHRGWSSRLADETQRCDRYGGEAGVISLDLDGLKQVNDQHGHAAGDDLLRVTGQTLLDTCRPSDVLARPGGDEFAVLAVAADEAALLDLCQRIRRALDRRGVAASVACASRAIGEDLTATWERADRAMYAVKRAGAPQPGTSAPQHQGG